MKFELNPGNCTLTDIRKQVGVPKNYKKFIPKSNLTEQEIITPYSKKMTDKDRNEWIKEFRGENFGKIFRNIDKYKNIVQDIKSMDLVSKYKIFLIMKKHIQKQKQEKKVVERNYARTTITNVFYKNLRQELLNSLK
jgi:hypothetical protein